MKAGSQGVLGGGVEAFEFQDRESPAFLRGVDEGEDNRLTLVSVDSLRGRELAAIARRNQP